VDGNDVDLDRQMVRLAQNALYHNSMVQILNQKFSALKRAISGQI
jgi:flagellar basal body rod protein FlgB